MVTGFLMLVGFLIIAGSFKNYRRVYFLILTGFILDPIYRRVFLN